jgi:hypothetical protein
MIDLERRFVERLRYSAILATAPGATPDESHKS